MGAGAGDAFIAVGMSAYDHHDDLEHIRALLPELCQVLTASRFTQHLAQLAGGGTCEQVQSNFTHSGQHGFGTLLLYWGGHGLSTTNGHFLLASDTPRDKIHSFNAIEAKALAGVLAAWRFTAAVIVIDTCHAGASAKEVAHALDDALSAQTFPDGRPGYAVIASCGPYDRTVDGSFAAGLVKVLREGGAGPAWAADEEFVRAEDIARHLDAHQKHIGGPEVEHRMVGYLPPLFPNPKALFGLPATDASTQAARQQLILERRLDVHFRNSARGIEVGEAGWFFTGRTGLMRDLIGWLEAGRPGLRVVTGSPGAGKSAVLGRIATLSDPAYRDLARAEGAFESAEPGTVPPPSLVDVAVHAKNKSLAECRDAVATALSIPIPEGGWRTSAELIDAVTALDRPVRILLDALDEARPAAILAIATDLLRPLAAAPKAQVLVGTRPQGPAAGIGGAASSGREVLLQALRVGPEAVYRLGADTQSAQDIQQYVRRRLASTPDSPYRNDPEATDATADAVADASDGIFLFARIVTRALLGRTEPLRLGTAEARRFLSGKVTDVFAADLARFNSNEKRVRELLLPLAFAEGGGFPRHLWPVVATALSPASTPYQVTDVDWLLGVAGHHVSQGAEDGQAVYRLYHQAFADYFRQEAIRG